MLLAWSLNGADSNLRLLLLLLLLLLLMLLLMMLVNAASPGSLASSFPFRHVPPLSYSDRFCFFSSLAHYSLFHSSAYCIPRSRRTGEHVVVAAAVTVAAAVAVAADTAVAAAPGVFAYSLLYSC